MTVGDTASHAPRPGGKDPSGYPESQPGSPGDAQRGGREKKPDPDDGGGLQRDPDGKDAPDK